VLTPEVTKTFKRFLSMKTSKILNLAILGVAALMSAATTACNEIPEPATVDISQWTKPADTYTQKTYTLNHPCLLHSQSDIDYVKAHLSQSPWKEAYDQLCATDYAKPTYQMHTPKEYVARLDATNWADGGGRWSQYGVEDCWYSGVQNSYLWLAADGDAAYQNALRYVLEGNTQCAEKAREILVEWAKVNKGVIFGKKSTLAGTVIDPNEYLILINIHHIANAAELIRDYNGFDKSQDFQTVCSWLKNYWGSLAETFLESVQGGRHTWLNWDLAAMTAEISIGVLCDDQDMINYTMREFYEGDHPGNLVLLGAPYLHDDPDSSEKLAQGNEAGRDQGHNTLCAALLGALCQMGYNVGEDLFAANDYRAVAMAEYVAKYNVSQNAEKTNFLHGTTTVPFTTYTYGDAGTMDHISDDGRGTFRPCWDLWVGYCRSHGVSCIYSSEFAEQKRPDAGVGYYGSTSGGFDQIGYTTLMHYRPAE
jgi:hypothetical protein